MVTLPSPQVTPLRGGPVLRWGVLAPGEIADAFVTTLHANTDQRVIAVGSRSVERAAAFAATHDIPLSYGSYEELVADDSIDVVYIAAPHSEHRRLALLAIGEGKHVLIEKPIALNAQEAADIAAAAREAGVFAMEAMWSRYLPQASVIRQLLDAGAIGEVKLVSVDLGWQQPYSPESRIFNPALGGGAMLDAGVYSLWFSQFVLGVPASIQATGLLAPTGVDAQAAATLDFESGAQASITTSVLYNTPGLAAIYCTEGSIVFDSHFAGPAGFTVTVGDEETTWVEPSGLVWRGGLAWQATALAQYVADGLTESPIHSLDDTITLMQTLDEVIAQVHARRG
jgi:predicted dehydrogenase